MDHATPPRRLDTYMEPYHAVSPLPRPTQRVAIPNHEWFMPCLYKSGDRVGWIPFNEAANRFIEASFLEEDSDTATSDEMYWYRWDFRTMKEYKYTWTESATHIHLVHVATWDIRRVLVHQFVPPRGAAAASAASVDEDADESDEDYDVFNDPDQLLMIDGTDVIMIPDLRLLHEDNDIQYQ